MTLREKLVKIGARIVCHGRPEVVAAVRFLDEMLLPDWPQPPEYGCRWPHGMVGALGGLPLAASRRMIGVRKPANGEFRFSKPERAESVTQPLEERFPSELCALSDLFGPERVVDALPRLNEIHDYTERKWRHFAARIPDGRVRYLLIAEAPPWSDRGAPQYVLDPGSRSRTLLRALRGAFLSSSTSRQLEPGEVLTQLAQCGLLVVDSIPFSMDFTKKRKRAKYDKLVSMTTRAYLMPKVQSASRSWSSDLRIAFSVKRNALAVMKALGNTLNLGDASHPLGPQLIAVSGAGYPDAKKLKAVYNL